MKAGWEVKALGEFADIRYGYTASANYEAVGPHFLRITDIQDGDVDWEKVPYCEISETDRKKFSLAVGDIVFARTGATTGKSYLIQDETDAVFASYLIKVRAQREQLDCRFLALYFQTSEYWDAVALGTEGAAQGGFNASKLATLPIPLPPLDEQKRIVEVLDAAFEGLSRARAHTETNLQNARELFESALDYEILQNGADWQASTLGEVCQFVGGSQPPKSDFLPNPAEGLVRLIQIRDYKSDAKAVYIPEKLARRFCAPDDIMIGRYGPPIFQILRGIEGAYNVALMKAVPDPKLLSKDFLFYFLKNREILRFVIEASSRAAGQDGVNKDALEAYPISFPDFDEQARIVERLKAMFANATNLQSHYRAKLADLDALRQALLQKAFAGELT